MSCIESTMPLCTSGSHLTQLTSVSSTHQLQAYSQLSASCRRRYVFRSYESLGMELIPVRPKLSCIMTLSSLSVKSTGVSGKTAGPSRRTYSSSTVTFLSLPYVLLPMFHRLSINKFPQDIAVNVGNFYEFPTEAVSALHSIRCEVLQLSDPIPRGKPYSLSWMASVDASPIDPAAAGIMPSSVRFS